MRYLLSIIFFLSLYGQALALPGFVTSSGKKSACTRDAGTIVYNQPDSDGTWGLAAGTQAAGQNITYGSPFQLHSIVIRHKSSVDCVMTLRVGTTADLTSPVEEWSNINVGTLNGDYEFVSVQNDTYTTIYWAVSEVSGTCQIGYQTTNPVASSDFRYGNAGGTDWDISGFVYTDERDLDSMVYKCQ